MEITVKNKKYTGKTFDELSKVYSELRDKSGQGASKFMPVIINDDEGKSIAHISYNGKVWQGIDIASMNNRVLLFNPYI